MAETTAQSGGATDRWETDRMQQTQYRVAISEGYRGWPATGFFLRHDTVMAGTCYLKILCQKRFRVPRSDRRRVRYHGQGGAGRSA